MDKEKSVTLIRVVRRKDEHPEQTSLTEMPALSPQQGFNATRMREAHRRDKRTREESGVREGHLVQQWT